MRPLRTITLLLSASLCTFAARAETVATVTSPNKVLTVELDLHEGRLAYRVLRFGEKVIDDSRLGFRLRGSGTLERNLELVSQSSGSHDQTWEQPWGESRFVRDHHNELRARIRETIAPHRVFDAVFRVFDDGVGFRYEFPAQAALAEAIIDDELTEFALAQPATAWWIPAGEWNRYEYLYDRSPVEQVTSAHTPMTVRTEDGLHLAFHEAALVEYAGMWLRRAEGRRFRAQLSAASEGWKVRRTLPFHTPWRTIQIADTAPALYASSDLVLNLNEPNKLGDVSWFQPAKYVGIWWSLHLET
ncbi:MAG: glycoside hydrolase family 97 N-terminal domain-containing protein, partial [Luteimonas sp.]